MSGTNRDQKAKGPDKRKFARADASFAIFYNVLSPFEERLNFGEKEKNAIANNLSEGGLSLYTDYPIPVGTTVAMKFRLWNQAGRGDEGSSRKCHVRGEARVCVRTGKKSYNVGISFVDLSREDRAFIASCTQAVKNS